MLRHIAQAIALAFALAPAVLAPAAVADTGPTIRARPVVEVVFVLDTTGSMGPLIEGAKRKIWSIATTIIDCTPDADIRMGLVAYRDIGDIYVTKRFDLTTDIQGLYGDLLQLRAQGGGDWPESVNEALFVGVTKMSWSYGRNSTRIVFLVGDAPPHMDYAQDMKYPEVMRIARSQGITVNAVQAGNARDTERYWREIAQMGHGEYIPIPQDGGAVVMIESPYDREIIELQGRINHTVIPYGPRQQRERVDEAQRAAPWRRPPRSRPRWRATWPSRAPARPMPMRSPAAAISLADVKAGRQKPGGGEGPGPARQHARDVGERAADLSRPADGAAVDAQRPHGRPGQEARRLCGRPAQEAAGPPGRLVRPRGREDVALADQVKVATASLRVMPALVRASRLPRSKQRRGCAGTSPRHDGREAGARGSHQRGGFIAALRRASSSGGVA